MNPDLATYSPVSATSSGSSAWPTDSGNVVRVILILKINGILKTRVNGWNIDVDINVTPLWNMTVDGNNQYIRPIQVLMLR